MITRLVSGRIGRIMSNHHTLNADEVDIDLAELLRSVWAIKFSILLIVTIVSILTYLLLITIKPKYTSEALILIESRESPFTQTESQKSGTSSQSSLLLDQEAVNSQVQVLLSHDLARSVIADLNLQNMEEFNSNKNSSSILSDVLILIGLKNNSLQGTMEARVLEKFKEKLVVFAVTGSRVITIRFTTHDPQLSAKIANMIAEHYLTMQTNTKRDNTKGASAWLQLEIKDLTKKVAEAEAEVEAFRANSDLVVGQNNITLNAQRLSEINAQLSRARGQKSEAIARARQIRQLLNSGTPLDGASEIINSSFMQRLQEQKVTLRAQIAELSSTLLPGHPRIKELNAQLTGLTRQIRNEAAKVVHSVEQDAKIATSRERQLKENLTQLKAEAANLSDDEVKLRALQREAKAQRELLESFLGRYREAASRENAAALPPDARIISSASVSTKPSFPKIFPMLAAATISSLVLSIIFVLAKELLSGRAVHQSHIEQYDENASISERSNQNQPIVATDKRTMNRHDAPHVENNSYAASPVSHTSQASYHLDHHNDHDDGILDDNHEKFSTENPSQMLMKQEQSEPLNEMELVPIAARLPWVSNIADAATPAFAVMEDLRSDFSSAIFNLAEIVKDSAPEVISVVGTSSNSGTTTTAIALARAYALNGAKVIFIETSSGSEDGEKMIGENTLPGLANLLEGEATFSNVIYRDRLSPVHIIPVGYNDYSDNSNLISDKRIEIVLDALVQTYDVVIIDADAWGRETRHMIAWSDAAVLVSSVKQPNVKVKRIYERIQDFLSGGQVSLAIIEMRGAHNHSSLEDEAA